MIVQLTKPLGPDASRVITKGEDQDLAGTVMDPQFLEAGIGLIELPTPVMTVAARVQVFGRDQPRDPWQEGLADEFLTKQIRIPVMPNYQLATGMETIDGIRWNADQLLRVCWRFEAGEVSEKQVRQWARRVQDQIVSHLVGPNGVLTTDILSVRCAHSIRAVAVPDNRLWASQVRLPREAALKAGIKEQDWVLLVRQPILHEGGVVLQQAWFWDEPAIGTNPSVLKPLGLDYDGDQVAVFKVPQTREALEEIQSKPLEELKMLGNWVDELVYFKSDPTVDWDHYMEDLEDRLVIDGTTFGPQDALEPENSPFALQADSSGCKSFQHDAKAWAKGVTLEEFVNESHTALVDIVRLKVEIGLVGALTDKICQICHFVGGTQGLSEALRFKECLTQTLMDAKHGLGAFSADVVTKIFERRGSWSRRKPDAAVRALVKAGVPAEVVTPIVNRIWVHKEGITATVREVLPLFGVTRYGVGVSDLVNCIHGAEQHGAAYTALQACGMKELKGEV